MSIERASKKQQELLAFVDGFIKGNGYGPSYREIMRALGYKSVSTVAIHIDALIAKGYLRRQDNSARSLEVVTLREPKTGQEKVDISAELSKLIDVKPYDTAQKDAMIQTFTYLGFDELVKKLEKED